MTKTGHSLVISGDCHGDFHRFGNQKIRNLCGEEFPSHAIILGDFGLIWSTNPDDRQEKYNIKWLNEKPWVTLAVLGNHCNYARIYQLPLVDLYGGKAYKLSDKIFILQHGHVFTIENRTFFNYGGGLSIDKAGRIDRVSWWEEEIPTTTDLYRAKESLKAVDYKVDFVITHTAPTEAIKVIKPLLPSFKNWGTGESYFDLKSEDPTVRQLDAIRDQVTCKKWLFGHFHLNYAFDAEGHQYQCMYENVEVLKD
jgi:hypothetical protein